LIPEEYDILIDFAPISYNSVNIKAGYQPQPSGKFRFRAKYQAEITQADRDDVAMQIVERLPSLTPDDGSGTTKEENTVAPVEEGEVNVEIIDDKPLFEEKTTTWDGEKIG
jgi:hypothetical protein